MAYTDTLLKLYLKGKGPQISSDYRKARLKEKKFLKDFKPLKIGSHNNKGGKISSYYKAGGNVITGRG